jgi:hypothetical protein
MNGCIIQLRDGTPCLILEETGIVPITRVEFLREGAQFIIHHEGSYDDGSGEKCVRTEYPLTDEWIDLLEGRTTIAVGIADDGDLTNLVLAPLAIVEHAEP